MKKITIGLLGFGTVNKGFYEGLIQFKERFSLAGYDVLVKKILVQNPQKIEQKPLSIQALCVSNIESILDDDDIEVIVEAINGAEPAGSYLLRALNKGKHVITANKAALALNWAVLHEASQAGGANLYYEASVCGGIPVIETLKTLVKVDDVLSIEGIVNGTTNYILSEMAAKSIAYEEALLAAQSYGYAEADPSADVDGVDAANKLTILCGLCFGSIMHPSDVPKQSIRHSHAVSIGEKSVAFAKRCEVSGTFEAGVKVMKLDKNHRLYGIEGVENALIVNTKNSGTLTFVGPGAGSKPTGTAMLLDLVHLLKTI